MARKRARVAAALKLAAELGGGLATIPAASVIEGLRAHLLESRATAIVIGKSQRSLWFRWRHGSVVDQLLRGIEGVTVHVIPSGKTISSAKDEVSASQPMPWGGFGLGLVLVALTTVAAITLASAIGANAISLLYLIPVIATATLSGLRPALVASITGALAYNFFFLQPVHTFTISDPQNAITFLVLTGVAILASQMTGRLKREANIGARTAAENAAIAGFGRQLAGVSDEMGTANIVCEEISAALGVSSVLLKQGESGITFIAGHPFVPTFGPIDFAAAEWTFEKGDTTGRLTNTLTASDWQFHPLVTSLGVLAVIGICSDTAGDPVPPDRQILFATLLGQAALAHERIKLEAKAREVGALQQRDNLRATLISSIGHDLRTPLTAVVASAATLAAKHGDNPTARTLQAEAGRLQRVFDDLVEMTRIEAGALVVRHDVVDLTDAVAAAATDLKAELLAHRLVLAVPPSLPLVVADPRMLHHILINLLGNAAKFAPVGTPITVSGHRDPDGLRLAVLDEGPGLPEGLRHDLFNRFIRVEGTDKTGGAGLGLAIVKGFADAMGLSVAAANRDDGNSVRRAYDPNLA